MGVTANKLYGAGGILEAVCHIYGLSWWVSGKKICLQCRRPRFYSWFRRFPGKERGYPSSILAQRILWTEEPGGLLSMGSQRVEHKWVTNTCIHTHTCTHTHRSHICPGCLTVCEVTHRVLQWSGHLLCRICSLNPTNFSQYSQSILLTSLMVVPKIKVVNSDENCMWENSGGKNENKSTQWVELKVVSILRN